MSYRDIWRKEFDTRAQAKDEAEAVDTNARALWEYRKIFFELLKLEKLPMDSSLLDIGCGTGTLTRKLSAVGYRLVCGVDFSHAMIKRAQGDGGAATYLQADATVLPFPDGTFDAVSCFGVLQCILNGEDRLKAIREVHRVLRPGGTAYFVTLNRYSIGIPISWILQKLGRRRVSKGRGLERFSPWQFDALLVEAGLIPQKIRGIYGIFLPLPIVRLLYASRLSVFFNVFFPLTMPFSHLFFATARKY